MHLLGGNLIHVKYVDVYFIRQVNRYRAQDQSRDLVAANTSRDPQISHLNFPTDSDYDDDDDGEMETSCEGSLRHAICVANQSEYSAYKEAVSGNADVPADEQPEFYIPSCDERHASCKMCGSNPKLLFGEDRKALRIDLNVLGVCRQLYEEANHLLWATNTFSFDDPDTFQKFFASLNPAQKRNLTRIHISTDIGSTTSNYYSNVDQRARWDSQYWGKGLKIRNLNTLKGLQTLHLCVNQVFECVPRQPNGLSAATAVEMAEKAQASDLEPILRLRALTLKDVTVVVSDRRENLIESGRSNYRWTTAKKNEYAKSIYARLVDPLGAQDVKTEAESAALARKKETRDNAATRIGTYTSIWKEKRERAIRYAKWADQAEAEAESAAQKAKRVPKKPSKRAKKLRDAAEKLRTRAMEGRATADAAIARKKYWREQVVNAREKYKRAIARLGATPEELEMEDEIEELMDGVAGFDTDAEEDKVVQADGSVQSGDDESL